MAIIRRIKKALAPVVKSLYWIPDRYFLSFVYLIKYHRILHLKNPKRFTEWIQWYKMSERNPIMLECTDKYKVREYIERKGLGRYLNELYQVKDSAEEIDFYALPDKFVIKTTDGGGGDNVFICRDKSSIDERDVIKRVNSWKNKHYERYTREWAYTGATASKIIVERLLEYSFSNRRDLIDYKIWCFNGSPRFIQVIQDRHSTETIDFFDIEWRHMDFVGLNSNASNADIPPARPDNLEEMLEISERLSKDFRFVRVDLYNIEGKIYFGELTFYPAGGYGAFTPDKVDFELGSYFVKE